MKLFILLFCVCGVTHISSASPLPIGPETLLLPAHAPAGVAELSPGARHATEVRFAEPLADLTIAETLSLPQVAKGSPEVASLTPEPSASLLFAGSLSVLLLARRKLAC